MPLSSHRYVRFNSNKAAYGGAVYTTGSFASDWGAFWYNNATIGGAIYSQSNAQFSNLLSLTNSLVSYNIADDMGGGIYMEGNYYNHTQYHVFNNLVMTLNSAARGGGFAIGGITAVNYRIENSSITSNTAELGGGAWIPSININRMSFPWFNSEMNRNNGSGLYIDFDNDTEANSFDLKGVLLQFNDPNNLECSDPSVPFCQTCQVDGM